MARSITRLCHFTPSRNLAHILQNRKGVLATARLSEDEAAILNPTDEDRFDGHLNHVCCSIQYPNAWYFKAARGREVLFKDWVVLFLNPRHLWARGTKFCQRNAATQRGALVREGYEAFSSLFDQTVRGKSAFSRGPQHPDFLPTDLQAEVLVRDNIERADLLGIAVNDKAQAKREALALRLSHAELPRTVIAPSFYEPGVLSQQLKGGIIPVETEFDGSSGDGR